MKLTISQARRAALVLLGVVLGVAGYIAISDGVFGSGSGTGEVRVATRSLDDGRVEVAVQQRAADADWSARQLPDARFLPADVESGVWRVSSGVPISAADADGSSLLCIVAHGATNDFFWRVVKGLVQTGIDRLGSQRPISAGAGRGATGVADRAVQC